MRDVKPTDRISSPDGGQHCLHATDNRGRVTSSEPLCWENPQAWAKWWLRQAELYPDKFPLDEKTSLFFEAVAGSPDLSELLNQSVYK